MRAKDDIRSARRAWTRSLFWLVVLSYGLALALVTLALFIGGVLSPPADMIAFTSDRTGNWEIYLLDVQRALLHNLTRHPAADLGPVWSRSTGQLAFYSDRDGDGAAEIYVMNFDGRGVEPLLAGESNVWRPQWSQDGQQIVFIENYGNIHSVEVASANQRRVSYGFGPVWSPTDSRIAFYADSAGVLNADIYLIDADGRNVRNLTQHPANDWDPAWSPDGNQIAFASSRHGNAQLFVIDAHCASSCEARRLTYSGSSDTAPAWSSDGTRIAFESETRGSTQIYIMNVDGRHAYAVTNSTSDSRSPIWLDK